MERLGPDPAAPGARAAEAVQPDINLVETLVGLEPGHPRAVPATARAVVRTVTDELEERLRAETVQAVTGALNRAARTRRPRHVRHRLEPHDRAPTSSTTSPSTGTVVPERLVGYARRAHRVERDIILCIDQSGLDGRVGRLLQRLRRRARVAAVASRRRLVVFDTAVVDLTERARRPGRRALRRAARRRHRHQPALAYCEGLITQPGETILVLISDLYEGGIAEEMLRRAAPVRRPARR